MPKRVCACFPNPGTGGVELLTTCMNSYFTRVIACIDEYDGDVVKFAGGWKKGSSTWPTRCKLLRFVLPGDLLCFAHDPWALGRWLVSHRGWDSEPRSTNCMPVLACPSLNSCLFHYGEQVTR